MLGDFRFDLVRILEQADDLVDAVRLVAQGVVVRGGRLHRRSLDLLTLALHLRAMLDVVAGLDAELADLAVGSEAQALGVVALG